MDKRDKLVEKHASKAGFRGRIDAKCIECIYDDIGGNGSWRKQVEACTSYKCPLYDIRAKSEGVK